MCIPEGEYYNIQIHNNEKFDIYISKIVLLIKNKEYNLKEINWNYFTISSGKIETRESFNKNDFNVTKNFRIRIYCNDKKIDSRIFLINKI